MTNYSEDKSIQHKEIKYEDWADNIKERLVDYSHHKNGDDVIAVMHMGNLRCEVIYMEDMSGDFLNMNMYVPGDENNVKKDMDLNYIDGTCITHSELFDMINVMTEDECRGLLEKTMRDFALLDKNAYKAAYSDEDKKEQTCFNLKKKIDVLSHKYNWR